MSNGHGHFTLDDCKVLELAMNHHPNGNLTVVEDFAPLPFKLERVYYLYDVPAGASRGGHAHRHSWAFLVAVSGCFDVEIDDGHCRRTVTLRRPGYGLLIAPGIWHSLSNFSGGSVCLVMSSMKYDEADYFRSYDDFLHDVGASAGIITPDS